MNMTHALQGYDGKLNFATDCWTSPNHCAFMAVTVHMEVRGMPLCLLLDVVEVAKAHTGMILVRLVSDRSSCSQTDRPSFEAFEYYLRQRGRKRYDDRGIE
jgi:hypothetical protein